MTAILAVSLGIGLSSPASAAPRPPNVVIFAPDGLRADRLGVYGYAKRQTSPAIDAAAKSALVFEAAEAQSSWTLPSFATLFTGRYPHEHGALWANARVAASELTLAEIFKMRGYRTGGFVGGPFLNPEYGFAQGFDVYNAAGSRYFSDTMPTALDWLAANKDEPFFLFVHGNDVHPPFNPALPEKVRNRFDADYAGPASGLVLDYYFVRVYNRYPWQDGPPPDEEYAARVDAVRADARSLEHIRALYDAQVARVDAAFLQLQAALKKAGVADNTIVVLLSDHGLELGERGLLATGYHPVSYESVTRVPLMIWGPGVKPGRRSDVAQIVDVAPTLLGLTRTPVPETHRGRALTAAPADGAPEPAALGAISTVGAKDVREYFLREGAWKLIFRLDGDKRRELYDLSADPEEAVDQSAAEPSRVRALVGRLTSLTAR